MASTPDGLWTALKGPIEERIKDAKNNCYFLYGYNFNDHSQVLSKIIFIREVLEDIEKEVLNVPDKHINE